ncbi:MAG: hypothetical protein U0169_02330 [Polyangiaceae bacterium]
MRGRPQPRDPLSVAYAAGITREDALSIQERRDAVLRVPAGVEGEDAPDDGRLHRRRRQAHADTERAPVDIHLRRREDGLPREAVRGLSAGRKSAEHLSFQPALRSLSEALRLLLARREAEGHLQLAERGVQIQKPQLRVGELHVVLLKFGEGGEPAEEIAREAADLLDEEDVELALLRSGKQPLKSEAARRSACANRLVMFHQDDVPALPLSEPAAFALLVGGRARGLHLRREAAVNCAAERHCSEDVSMIGVSHQGTRARADARLPPARGPCQFRRITCPP